MQMTEGGSAADQRVAPSASGSAPCSSSLTSIQRDVAIRRRFARSVKQ